MKARPILMSSPMVRALLDGRKTQTRRVVKPQPHAIDQSYGDVEESEIWAGEFFQWHEAEHGPSFYCPYGDLLWVRETITHGGYEAAPITYAADGAHGQFIWPSHWKRHCRPSIHMPRWASRLTLELTGVRVERLKEISLNDVWAEGCEVRQFWLFGADTVERQRIGAGVYQNLWESINGPGSWDANPWVWVLEFRIHQVNVDALLRARAA
jgi:hypothetical protein